MKRISLFGWIAALLVSVITPSLFAREWVEQYVNARSQAMGGTQVALTSDDTSLYRNPANLGSLRGYSPTIFDPEIEISQNFFGQVNATATGKAFDVEKVSELLDSHREKYYHAKLQLSPTFSIRHFAIGLIYKNEISAIKNAAGTEMDTLAYEDVGAFIGANYNFWDGRIKIGATAKLINRIEVNNPNLDTTASLTRGDIASEGTAFTGDVGLILQAPVVYLPTLAVVARDIGDAKYEISPGLRLSTTDRPQVVKQSYDVGLSIMPIHSNSLRSVWSVEYRDAQDSREEDFTEKRLHAGFEFNWSDLFFLRGGWNQGYWTGGLELAGEHVSWQLTTYGEEVGTKDDRKEDRRYSTKIAVRF